MLEALKDQHISVKLSLSWVVMACGGAYIYWLTVAAEAALWVGFGVLTFVAIIILINWLIEITI